MQLIMTSAFAVGDTTSTGHPDLELRRLGKREIVFGVLLAVPFGMEGNDRNSRARGR
jgi:hypothetical protein